ncbi:uncharacterized protein LOC128280492 [Gossypium arboreum]|uniref:uncharacterized protein LOC128280492 n=1 Tax=Gossypium arboreum TaxID=29729 RepID=UPI0022F1B066|nr:uncharacterized protein LOC128280492 [Gossypium arboreum]
MESNVLNGRIARWQILLSEFDIVYVNQKAVKGSAIADFLASRALEDYELLSFDFPNEDLIYVVTTEEDSQEGHLWKLNFDGASNAVAIERKIKVLEVYGDSALVIYLLKGEWETRDPKLINYRRLPIQMSIYETSAHCCNIEEEEEKDDHPWYQDILRYVKSREYPDQATENDKRTLRRVASDYVLDGEILYKRRKDQERAYRRPHDHVVEPSSPSAVIEIGSKRVKISSSASLSFGFMAFKDAPNGARKGPFRHLAGHRMWWWYGDRWRQ